MIEIVDRPETSRYEVLVDGEAVGFCNYRRTDEAVVLPHLEVREDLNGQGVGTALARGTLDDLRRHGLSVVPICPFVIDFIHRNPEYADLVHHG